MSQQIGWSVESKLLYEIKQLTRQLSGRQYILTFPNFASFPTPGITGTLYVDESTGDIYVWNGTAYTLLSAGITALNGLIAAAQLLVTGSTGTDFNISSVGTTHTFNIPTASATNRGLLSSGDWTTFNSKIAGTGTTNYVPKFTAASTIGNSIIQDNGTGVGIGGTQLDRLTIFQDQNATTTARVRNTDVGSSAYSQFVVNASGNSWGFRMGSSAANSNALDIVSDALGTPASRLRITSGGDVGVGTSSPISGSVLDVASSTNVYPRIRSTGTGEAFQFYQNSTSGSTAADGLFVGINSGNDAFFYNAEATPARFFTSATERLRIFANGRVGVNTTTDAGYQFDVNGTLRSVNGANFATTSGNVGIGITTVTGGTKFEVAGNISIKSGADAFLQTTDANNIILRADQQAGTSGKGVYAQYWNGSAWTNAMYVNNVASGFANLILQASGGNVGIGTTTPNEKLTIQSGVSVAAAMTFRANNATSTSELLLGQGTTNEAYFFNRANQPISIGTNNTERIRITAAGNVGINTSTPSKKTVISAPPPTIAGDDGLVILDPATANQTYLARCGSAFTYLGIPANAGLLYANTSLSLAADSSNRLTFHTSSGLIAQFVSNGNFLVNTTTDAGQRVQINSSLRLVPTSTVPTASAGTLYYDTATNKLKLYDGTSWVDLN